MAEKILLSLISNFLADYVMVNNLFILPQTVSCSQSSVQKQLVVKIFLCRSDMAKAIFCYVIEKCQSMVSRKLYQNTFSSVSKVPINQTAVAHGKLYLQVPATFEPSLYFC